MLDLNSVSAVNFVFQPEISKQKMSYLEGALVAVGGQHERQGAEGFEGDGEKAAGVAGDSGALLAVEKMQDARFVAPFKFAPPFFRRLLHVVHLHRRTVGFRRRRRHLSLHVVPLQKFNNGKMRGF